MTQLDRHLSRVEQHGFDRSLFPLSYRGHNLIILQNDAHPTDDDRMHFHFTLWCSKCDTTGSMSGRFPSHDTNMVAHVANARIAVFDSFASACQNG